MRYDLSAYYYDWYHFQTNRFDQAQSMYIASDAGRARSLTLLVTSATAVLPSTLSSTRMRMSLLAIIS